MSQLIRCPICKKMDYSSHKCKPVWFVAPKDAFDFTSPEDHTKVFERDAETAAAEGLQKRDLSLSGDRTMGSIDMIAYEQATGEFYEVLVTVEWVAEYSATRAKQLELDSLVKKQAALEGILANLTDEPKHNYARYSTKKELEFVTSIINAIRKTEEDDEDED